MMTYLWRDLSYSFSVAAIIAALSALSHSWVGEVVANPGIIIEGILNLLIVSLSKDPYVSLVHTWPIFNMFFYSMFIFALLRVVRWIRYRP